MQKLIGTFLFIFLSAQAGASSMIEVDGGRIEYEIKAGGDTVVLFDAGALPGMAGWDSIWSDLPEEITGDRKSVV